VRGIEGRDPAGRLEDHGVALDESALVAEPGTSVALAGQRLGGTGGVLELAVDAVDEALLVRDLPRGEVGGRLFGHRGGAPRSLVPEPPDAQDQNGPLYRPGAVDERGLPQGARSLSRMASSASLPPFDPMDPVGMDVFLSEDEKDVRSSVRQLLADRVEPHVAGWFEAAHVENIRELVKEFGAMGLLGMHLEGYGCAGMSSVQYGLACLELEAVDSGIRSLVSVQGSLAMYAIWKYGSEEQKQEWLPPMAAGEAVGCFGLTEPDAGSDPGAMRTRARKDGEDWVLDGRKMWITNGSIADVAVVWAQTEDPSLRQGSGQATGSGQAVRGFVVPTDTPGFSAPEIEHKLSLRASVTSELVLDGVRLPSSAVLPEVSGLRGPLGCLNEARFGIVWGSMGAARSAYRTAVRYAQEREQFGKPIGGFQLTQQKLADMAVEYSKGVLLALHLGRLKDQGLLRPEQVSIGKLNNVREALEICRTARTVLGANGISLEYPVIRHMNNLESVLTYEGTVEMHTLVLGQAITGHAAFR